VVYNPSFRVAMEKQEVVVRFRRDAVDFAALERFLDYLELESIRKRSQLSAEQAAALADEIDKSVWKTLKESFTEA
jgi:hypothetical protein